MSGQHRDGDGRNDIQQDTMALQERLADSQRENFLLRRQLYHTVALLDIAVSRLAKLGLSLETPIDLRKIREEAMRHVPAEFSRGAETSGASFPHPTDPLNNDSSANTRGDTIRGGIGGSGGDRLGTTAGERLISASSAVGTGAVTFSSRSKFSLFTSMQHHTKAIQCCSFAPGDTGMIASGGLDRKLVVCNFTKTDTSVLCSLPAAHKECISDVSWLGPHLLLSASYDGTAKVWDVGSEGKMIFHYDGLGLLLSAIPLDKSHLFACADSQQNVAIVDTRMHKPRAFTWEMPTRVNSLAYDASTSHLFMGQSDGCVSVWDIRKSGASQQLSSTAIGSGESRVPCPHGGTGLSLTNPAAVPPSSGSPPTTLSQPMVSSSVLGTSYHMRRVWTAQSALAHSGIAYITHVHSDDDTKRLVSVTNDYMVRLYRGTLNAPSFTSSNTPGSANGPTGGIGSSSGAAGVSRNDLYTLHTALPNEGNFGGRGATMRSAFWKGVTAQRLDSSLYDDDMEKDGEDARADLRRVTECDLLITGGSMNRCTVYDVSEAGNPKVVETLEGHRDRVTGAAVHHTMENLIIATTGADASVRIWLPSKS